MFQEATEGWELLVWFKKAIPKDWYSGVLLSMRRTKEWDAGPVLNR